MSACYRTNRKETGAFGLRNREPWQRRLLNCNRIQNPESRIAIAVDEFALAHTPRKSATSVSIARWLAWAAAWGRPPTFWTKSSLLTWRAWSTLLPFASSVIAEPQAIAGTQPLARKRMSAMRLPSSFSVSSRMSPQAGFSKRAVRSGASILPAFRGFWKWSRSSAEYTL